MTLPWVRRSVHSMPRRHAENRAEWVTTHPQRARALDAIRAHPGVSTNDLLNGSGIDRSTLRHHLDILIEEGYVDGRLVSGQFLFFPRGHKHHPLIGHLYNRERRLYLAAVIANPGKRTTEISTIAGLTLMQGRHAGGALERAGLIHRDGWNLNASPGAEDCLREAKEAWGC